jgi:hypothetical protein
VPSYWAVETLGDLQSTGNIFFFWYDLGFVNIVLTGILSGAIQYQYTMQESFVLLCFVTFNNDYTFN